MKIGLISVTLNAQLPMTDILKENGFTHIRTYLDEELQRMVQDEGQVTERSIERMSRIIDQAVLEGAEAVVLTCTVFTPIIDRFKTLFSIPIISADGVMLEQAAKENKKTAILCTFSASIETSCSVFQKAAGDLGLEGNAAAYLLEDAAEALKGGNKLLHDSIIAQKARELGNEIQLVVLAQISMAQAASLLGDVPFTVYTSPACVVQALKDLE
jgi:glutamate racemase